MPPPLCRQSTAKLSAEFHVCSLLVRQALDESQSTLWVNGEVTALIDELVSARQQNLRIKAYAVSNIGEEHFHAP
jgi:hypothetical protein